MASTTGDDAIDHLCWVCEKPGMYLLSVRFDSVSSYIDGFDHARGGEPLRGFREWLCTSRDSWSNAPWYILVRERLYAGGTPVTWVPGADEHSALIQETRRLLQEFKAARASRGVEKLLLDYEEWEKRQRSRR